MDLRIRQFLDELIALTNAYDDIPLEARRLALESVMYNTERAANKAIQQQNEAEAQRITKELACIQEPSEESNLTQQLANMPEPSVESDQAQLFPTQMSGGFQA